MLGALHAPDLIVAGHLLERVQMGAFVQIRAAHGVQCFRGDVFGAEFQILEDYDIDPTVAVDLQDVVTANGVDPLLVGPGNDQFIISDGAAEPTYTIGPDTYNGVELAEYLAETSTDTGGSITGSLTINNNTGPVADAGAPFTTTNAEGMRLAKLGLRS